MGLAASKQEAFWEACGFGHINRVKRFIEEGTDVNWVSYTHNSCAIHVASQGKPEIVKMLIDANCNINAKDDRGNLALHHAAMKGHADIMQMLIDAGSEINTQDKNGWTPLLNAAYFCQPDAVENLIKNNCDVNIQNKDERTALHEACRSQSEDDNGLAIIVCHLVEASSNINAKSSDVGEADFTPLMFAAYHGHAEVAEVLAEASCDINAQGSNGWTALHWAVDRGHKNVAEVLLGWGIDPLIEGRRGELALDRAQDNSLKELLMDATSQAKNQRDMNGMMSHSPVSTTSPLSSSHSSSLSSSLANIQEDVLGKDVDQLINNELASKLEAIVIERSDSGQGGDSSCTSGTISEKDEKEPLEKDINQSAPPCDWPAHNDAAVNDLASSTEADALNMDRNNVQVPNNSLDSTNGCDLLSDNVRVNPCADDVHSVNAAQVPSEETAGESCGQVSADMLELVNQDTPVQVSHVNNDTGNDNIAGEVPEVNNDVTNCDPPGEISQVDANLTNQE